VNHDPSVLLLSKALQIKSLAARVLSENAEKSILDTLEQDLLDFVVAADMTKAPFTLHTLHRILILDETSLTLDYLIQARPKLIPATFSLRGWVDKAETTEVQQMADDIWSAIVARRPHHLSELRSRILEYIAASVVNTDDANTYGVESDPLPFFRS